MITPTLQPQILLALQYLFQIWKQDNAAQNNTLWIISLCIWLCDNNDTTQTIDLTNLITSFLEPDSNTFLNTLEDTEQLEINLPEKLSRIIQDIIQPCGPLTQTSTPPQDQTKLLKAYYHLGDLIEKYPDTHKDIRSTIRKTQGERRARDT
ncbi:18215_t:CDS:2 [Racocetra persica]|uniref:18215_t:CDS:1 n=1 Tax=Racocetra persica TaxID=160502 RepID=A0ACA9P910_9GLOM|nr:18215_t:CDS:2 [Racocetra persica]